ncbi:helix-turn-helix transcriptional regulator [Bradyrhizobium sp. WSM 1704]|uniref:winged helix-turn-helix transcriptional regulator n=1 Tax=Bradyrhizobium semiaridum TaxID=2821404 RepID=UPI001CE292A9|nr:helix-turn-helix domain-containing protein [Bradyrhizobium semiaridum]MCA6123657.1 helix-turn-helix transcriptional regulator [Bradyrhizobium semiaridum]
MKRTGFARADCPVARALDAIGDWWSLLIVRDAFDGLRRFGDFQQNLGIAKGMLTARLRKLVELGVLEQVAASDGSAYQEYVLTKRGRALFPVVVSLRQWGEANLFARGEPHSVLVDAQGERVGQLVLPSKAGRPLNWSDTRVKKVGSRKR